MDFKIIGEANLWAFNKETEKFEIAGTSKDAIEHLAQHEVLGVDTETTGLKWAGKDKVFSIAVSPYLEDRPSAKYYINFQDYKGPQLDMFDQFEDDWIVKDVETLHPLFNSQRVWVGHNLKFDWHMLNKSKLAPEGILYDTMVNERLISNDEMSYSLANCVKRNFPDLSKDDAVEDYIDKKGLYDVEDVPGKKTKIKNKYYYLVPFRIIAPYATNDIDITLKLYKSQRERAKLIPRDQTPVQTLEGEVLRICCAMEERGVLVDENYCNKGIEHEDSRVAEVAQRFKQEFGKKFVDSANELGPVFKELGFNPPQTEKANDSIDSNFLESVANPLARAVEQHRDATKRANTYFRSFVSLADRYNVLHPDMKQSGTRTGRFSYADPNLQNIPKEDESPFPIRRAIIPRAGHFFAMVDYQQQEFRMMLDYAAEMELIGKIIAGHDPHQATADLCGIGRREAKTINFGLMYGMGIQKLANRLGITYDEAKQLKYKYFAALPKVKNLIYTVTDVAKQRGAVYTWMNRKCDFKNPDFAYKAINAIIQGGCADVTKLAMVGIWKYLKENNLESRMALQIHDELVFEVPFKEAHIMGDIQAIMEKVYPHKHIPLTTSLSYSVRSLHDTNEAKNSKDLEAAIGVELKRQSGEIFKDTAENVVH